MALKDLLNLIVKPATQPGESGAGVAQIQVPWEYTAPQYPIPAVYPLAQTGYSRNEIIFSCIQRRMKAVGQAPLDEWDGAPEDSDSNIIKKSPLKLLLDHPNDFMTQKMFWQATQLYMDVAGFAVWEKQYKKNGQIYALYPMRPDWCSFMRGPDKLLGKVRYQPAGLQYQDVPIERCVVFMELNPIWMGLRPVSRSAVAMRVGTSDNAATDFVANFFQRGAVISGYIKVQQSLQKAEADRIRQDWQEQHSGANAGNVGVLGQGADFVPATMSFKDMDFTNLDGRDEARICSIYDVPPMLLGAKVGLAASTYSNYKEARGAFYEETVSPIWDHYASIIEQQLAPDFTTVQRYYAFDTRNVKALQEDQDALHNRLREDAKANLITRDEFRVKTGDKRIDNEAVFVGVMVRTQSPAGIEAAPDLPLLEAQDQAALNKGGTSAPTKPMPQAGTTPAPDVAKALGEWRKAAIEAVKAKTAIPANADYPEITAALQGCKSASDVRAVFDKHWPKPEAAPADTAALVSELMRVRELMEAQR